MPALVLFPVLVAVAVSRSFATNCCIKFEPCDHMHKSHDKNGVSCGQGNLRRQLQGQVSDDFLWDAQRL